MLTVALHTWTAEPGGFSVKERSRKDVLCCICMISFLWNTLQLMSHLKVVCCSLHLIQRSCRVLNGYLRGAEMEHPRWGFYGLLTEPGHIHHLQPGKIIVLKHGVLCGLWIFLRNIVIPQTVTVCPAITHHRVQFRVISFMYCCRKKGPLGCSDRARPQIELRTIALPAVWEDVRNTGETTHGNTGSAAAEREDRNGTEEEKMEGAGRRRRLGYLNI